MPRIHVRALTVPPEAIDALGHVNNLEYVRWMQEVATEHSAVQGWPLERYAALGAGWFVRRHEVEYLRPAFAGDALRILTWVDTFERASSSRRYLFHRAHDAAIVARAQTLWVFVNYASGAPLRIPADVRAAFDVATEAEALRVANAGADGDRAGAARSG